MCGSNHTRMEMAEMARCNEGPWGCPVTDISKRNREVTPSCFKYPAYLFTSQPDSSLRCAFLAAVQC